MKILNIVETAYRATLEEQDDTTLWFCHALKLAEANLDLLLQGNAVNYAVAAQDASGLKIGNYKQTQPPRIPDDVKGLIEKGCKVFVVSEDLDDRGIMHGDSIEGLQLINRAEVAACLDQYHQVWYW